MVKQKSHFHLTLPFISIDSPWLRYMAANQGSCSLSSTHLSAKLHLKLNLFSGTLFVVTCHMFY